MPDFTPSAKKIPCRGSYQLCARAAATETKDKKSGICHLYEESEMIEIDDVWISVDGQCRGHGPHGWVSFTNERGKVLLELVEEPIGFGLTKQKWRDFCENHGISKGGKSVETGLITVAARELLPDAQTDAFGPAYLSIAKPADKATIERTQLERLLLHYIFLSERWLELEELRANRGDKLSLEDFTRCCRALSYPISDPEAKEEFERLALDGDKQLNFAYDNAQDTGQLPAASLCFHSWIAHRKTQTQTLEPSVEPTTSRAGDHSGSLGAETSSYDHSSDHVGSSEVLQRAMDLHDVLQENSSQEPVGSLSAVATPRNMPPIPPKALPAELALRYGNSSDLPSETVADDEGDLEELEKQFRHITSPVAAPINAAQSPTRLPEKGRSGNLRLLIESGELSKDNVSSPSLQLNAY